ncbi:MAG: hypothetical protein J2P21_13870 [Chloracidobacterium sp.]|nr:hypothetical protein [Chloracidobacterium sp.]
MKMKSRDLIFIAIVIGVVGGLVLVSIWQRPPAMLATTPEHLTARQRGECLKCHTPEKLADMELHHKHPIKWRDEHTACIDCHKPPREATALNARRINELAAFLR